MKAFRGNAQFRDYPFFRASYRPGEASDDAMLRLFKAKQWWTAGSDEQAIAALTHPR